MRVLVVGAGAIGGYFGGRLLQTGRDVTFLVRARREAELADAGLIIKSSCGNVTIRKPATIPAEKIRHPIDLVLLSCKAYDLAAAMESFAAAVGPASVVLLAALASSTYLMRAPIGDIMASPGGKETVGLLLEECRVIADEAGHSPRTTFLEQARAALTAPGSPLTASMLRDVEDNAPVEADHIVGDLLRRRGANAGRLSILATAYTHLKAYQARRGRASASTTQGDMQ